MFANIFYPFKAIISSYLRIPLFVRILISFFLGAGLGIIFSFLPKDNIHPVIEIIKPFGTALISMLKMIVFPIIFFSLILGAASLPLKKAGKLGGAVIGWYLVTSVFATMFGIFIALLLNPTMRAYNDVAVTFQSGISSHVLSEDISRKGFSDFITNLFQNPFYALTNGDFLSIIVFAILVGLASRVVLDSAKVSDSEQNSVQSFLNVCGGCQIVSFKIIDWIVQYFPIGIFALTFTNFSVSGLELFAPYLRIILCVVVGTVGMVVLVYPLGIWFFCRENPYILLWRLKLPIITAFTTRSSAATLSVSIKVQDKMGVSSSLSSFSLPLGCTINMDGVCVHLPVFVILASNIFGTPVTPYGLLVLLVSVVLASIGAGGIPGGSVFLLFMILENAGFSAEQVTGIVGLALGVNPLLDMFETACNVTGDNVCTYIVAKRNGLIAVK